MRQKPKPAIPREESQAASASAEGVETGIIARDGATIERAGETASLEDSEVTIPERHESPCKVSPLERGVFVAR